MSTARCWAGSTVIAVGPSSRSSTISTSTLRIGPRRAGRPLLVPGRLGRPNSPDRDRRLERRNGA
jgi:hypothetical protein